MGSPVASYKAWFPYLPKPASCKQHNRYERPRSCPVSCRYWESYACRESRDHPAPYGPAGEPIPSPARRCRGVHRSRYPSRAWLLTWGCRRGWCRWPALCWESSSPGRRLQSRCRRGAVPPCRGPGCAVAEQSPVRRLAARCRREAAPPCGGAWRAATGPGRGAPEGTWARPPPAWLEPVLRTGPP